MEDRSAMVGASLPPFTFAVERGKIREFAQAIGDLKDIYLDPLRAREEGYADVVAPPTFGMAVELWGGPGFAKLCEIIKADPVKVLHGEQEYHYQGDIVAGDEITVNTTIAEFIEKKSMYLITMASSYVNQKGEEVLKSRMVIAELK